MEGNHERRLDKLEAELEPRGTNPFGGKDIVICIKYYKTEITETGERREVPTRRASADAVDWAAIEPDGQGDRICVRYPDEDPPAPPAEGGVIDPAYS